MGVVVVSMDPGLHADAHAVVRGVVEGLVRDRVPTVPRTDVVMVLLEVALELVEGVALVQGRRQLLAERGRRLYVELARPLDRRSREVMDLATARDLSA